jgi:hypothetical protein
MLFVSFFHDEAKAFLFVYFYLFCVFTVLMLFCELHFVSMTASLKSEDCSLYYFGLHRVHSN